MPEEMYRKQMKFEWFCPELFMDLCEKNAKGPVLKLPWRDVTQLKDFESRFGNPYSFMVEVTWKKAHD